MSKETIHIPIEVEPEEYGFDNDSDMQCRNEGLRLNGLGVEGCQNIEGGAVSFGIFLGRDGKDVSGGLSIRGKY